MNCASELIIKKSGIPSETITAEISECEEYEGKGDNSEDATGQPVIRIKRISPQTAVGSGESFGLELELENTSKESDIEDLIVNISPGNGLYITDDTGSQVVSSLGLKQKKENYGQDDGGAGTGRSLPVRRY